MGVAQNNLPIKAMLKFELRLTLAKNQKTCCRNLALKKTEAAAARRPINKSSFLPL
jgi:hypothetical protein